MPMGSMFVVVAALLKVIIVDANSVDLPATKTKSLYYLRDDKLYRLKPPSLREEVLQHDVLDFVLDANSESLWMDIESRIYRSSDDLILRYRPSVSTARFALDYLTDKFYVANGYSRKIDVLQFDNKRTVLFEGENAMREIPQMIALDPSRGLMFVLTDLDGVRNIYRADMDGKKKRKLAEDVSSDELSIDVRSRKIYWVNTRRCIAESIDYEGIERRAVHGLEGVTNETAIAVLDEDIFWSVDGGQISVCKLRDDSCDYSTLYRLKLSPSTNPIKYLKLSDISVKDETASTNSCRPYNGGCQHMCLLNSQSGGSCVCYIEWEPNGKKCNPKEPSRRSPWYSYMTRQSNWKPRTTTPTNSWHRDVAIGLAIIINGK